jgi:hypothetical protein
MTEEPSRQTLELVPGRCVTFVLNTSKYPAISAKLAAKGYKQAETDFVWSRLSTLGMLPKVSTSVGVADAGVANAIIELDAWDEVNFGIIKAVLNRFYPDYVDTLFMDLEPKQGPEAVAGVSTLLDRLDTLEKGTDPKAPAIIGLLGDRGYPATERKRLRDLVTKATTFAPKPLLTDDERVAILKDLYAWIIDWSATARAVITRRQHQINLGIASPRKPKEAAVPAPVAPAAPAPAIVAPGGSPAPSTNKS